MKALFTSSSFLSAFQGFRRCFKWLLAFLLFFSLSGCAGLGVSYYPGGGYYRGGGYYNGGGYRRQPHCYQSPRPYYDRWGNYLGQRYVTVCN